MAFQTHLKRMNSFKIYRIYGPSSILKQVDSIINLTHMAKVIKETGKKGREKVVEIYTIS